MPERLQKILAAAGHGSRRACEDIVLQGRVCVNGKRVSDLPVLVEPDDDIRVDSQPIKRERKVYYLLNKPKGVVCTNWDPAGRKRAVDLLPWVQERVFPVGRLDAESQGLLLMTNDGELTAILTHPRYGVPKTYRARVKGKLTGETLVTLRKGMWLSDGRTQPARVAVAYSSRDYSVLEITLREGRNRQVRRMLAKLGHPVRELTRISIGQLDLRRLGSGRIRPLQPKEVAYLKKLVVESSEETAERTAGGKKRKVVKKRKAPSRRTTAAPKRTTSTQTRKPRSTAKKKTSRGTGPAKRRKTTRKRPPR
jgi:23S rRNA pseudouridine2605 synthase